MLNLDGKERRKRVYTPEQQFNNWKRYQIESHHREIGSEALQYINKKMIYKWSIKDGLNLYKFPPWLLGKVYSAIEAIVFKGRVRKGRIIYWYIPEEWTVDGHPIIVDVDVELNIEPPAEAKVMNFRALKDTFIHNKFQD